MSSIEEKLQIISDNTPKVYESGKKEGMSYFWNKYQDLGARTGYSYAFAGSGWTDELFEPKFNMAVKNANRMFASSNIENLKALLEKRGIILDFSNCTSFTNIISESYIVAMGIIDTRSASSLNATFGGGTYLKHIDKFILKSEGTQSFSSASFQYLTSLQHVIFEGTIGTNNFNVQWSINLDKDSLMSILNCLADKTGNTSTTWNVTIGTTNKAKLTSEELEIAYDKGWLVE
jgi:hypothetical protein